MKYIIKGPGYEAIITITDKEFTDRYSKDNEEVKGQLAGNITLAFATLYCSEKDKLVFRLIDMMSLEFKENYLSQKTLDDVVINTNSNKDPKNKLN